MSATRAYALGAALGWIVMTAAACSGASSTTTSSDGGASDANPAGCPTAMPATGAPCAPSGLDCRYGCSEEATCTDGTWAVHDLGISCPAGDGGMQPDGMSPDGAVTCSKNGDCPSGLECSPGGGSYGCGICEMAQDPCNVDSDCMGDAAASSPRVCGPLGECTCAPGGQIGQCIPACQPGGCGPDEACDPSGHCVSKPCTSDTDCPSSQQIDYACSAAGTCAPKTCTTNADCGDHYCVGGTCYPQQGICVGPAA